MVVMDALYGRFELPRYLDGLLGAPEVRRLAEVRLININSPTLPALADVRRYSHTLGVLRLALLNPMLGLDPEQVKAFLAGILLHDAGTPAFAHLFEYALADRYRWHHETAASDLLSGRHHPDGHAHQIFGAVPPKFRRLCRGAGIDQALLLDFVQGTHPYSKLIFGSLDFDNLDNVARMNWMMGLPVDLPAFLRLAANVSVSPDGTLTLPRRHRADVEAWMESRAAAYRVLVFDPATVAGQAVLSKAIATALDAGYLDQTDWHYTDRDLIRVLLDTSPAIKRSLMADYLNGLPALRLVHVIDDDLRRYDGAGRATVSRLSEDFMREVLQLKGRVYGYVFRDRGAFAKSVGFVDPDHGDPWALGKRSDSMVVYGFSSQPGRVGRSPEQAGRELREWLAARL